MHSTQNTDDGQSWIGLLSALTDDELRRYGEIAADQRALENRYIAAQVLFVIGSLAALAWAVRSIIVGEPAMRTGAFVGLAIALGYWPYRKAIVRRLWSRHANAVERELAGRQALSNR